MRLHMGALVVALATAATSVCGAQQQHYLVEETTAVAGASAQFEAAQKDYCAAVVRGGAPECLVLSPTTFSPRDEYLTLLGFGSFAHYDEGTYTSKGMTPEQAQELRQRRLPTIASNTESAISLLPQGSFPSIGQGELAQITDIEIEPGSLPALLEYMHNVELPAARHNRLMSCELYQVVAGGNTNRFLLVRRFNTFSQLDGVIPFGDGVAGPGHAAAAGKELALRRVRTNVMRIRGDLSASR